jgi:hypothetical protein
MMWVLIWVFTNCNNDAMNHATGPRIFANVSDSSSPCGGHVDIGVDRDSSSPRGRHVDIGVDSVDCVIYTSDDAPIDLTYQYSDAELAVDAKIDAAMEHFDFSSSHANLPVGGMDVDVVDAHSVIGAKCGPENYDREEAVRGHNSGGHILDVVDRCDVNRVVSCAPTDFPAQVKEEEKPTTIFKCLPLSPQPRRECPARARLPAFGEAARLSRTATGEGGV